jgi:hypothetical protein
MAAERRQWMARALDFSSWGQSTRASHPACMPADERLTEEGRRAETSGRGAVAPNLGTLSWRALRDSNPCFRRERAMS